MPPPRRKGLGVPRQYGAQQSLPCGILATMRTRVQCNCGWQRELSEFYAGKRIRCADCMAIIDVPPEPSGKPQTGAYLYPPMIDWPSGRYVKPRGRWVTIATPARDRSAEAYALPGRVLTEEERRKRHAGRRVAVALLLFPLCGVFSFVLLIAVLGYTGSPAERPPQHRHSVQQVEVETPEVETPEVEAPVVKPHTKPSGQSVQPKEDPAEPVDPDDEQEDEF